VTTAFYVAYILSRDPMKRFIGHKRVKRYARRRSTLSRRTSRSKARNELGVALKQECMKYEIKLGNLLSAMNDNQSVIAIRNNKLFLNNIL